MIVDTRHLPIRLYSGDLIAARVHNAFYQLQHDVYRLAEERIAQPLGLPMKPRDVGANRYPKRLAFFTDGID